MTPYREPAEIAEDIPEMPRPKRDIDWYVFKLIWLGFALLSAFGMYKAATWVEPPCSSFADTPMDRVPARCTKNFDGEKP